MSIALHIDDTTVATLAEQIAERAAEILVERLASQQPTPADGGRLAIPEAEAAEMCSLQIHQLREQRRLGRIVPLAARPGGRILYAPSAIRAFLDTPAKGGKK